MTFKEWWTTAEAGQFRAAGVLLENMKDWSPAGIRKLAEAAFQAGREVHVEIGVSSLNVKITEEGVIMDAYDDDLNEHIGTLGMTYDEWFDFVIKNDPANIEDIEGVWGQ